MDSVPAPTTLRNRATPRLVPLADIAIPDQGLRRTATSAEQDAGMVESVTRLGVLQPIILRFDPLALGRYILVAGRRRYRAATEAGLGVIPAEVHDDLAEADAAAIEAAENLQRAAMAPVDQWRAIARLQELGWDLDGAAAALGIPQRTTRRLAKLGTLHPDMLAAIETHGLPPDAQLAVIAAAEPDAQAAALAKNAKGGRPDWWSLASALRQQRIPKAHAIFDADAAGILWEEDLFAAPGSPEQWTTRDLPGFLAAQRAALEAAAAASKGRIVVAQAEYGRPKLPKGVEIEYGWKWGDAVPKGATVYAIVMDHGPVAATLTRKPAKAETAERDAGEAEEEEGEEEPDGGRPAGKPAGPPPRFSRAGFAILSRLRTDALRAALRDRPAPDPVAALRLLLVALGAENLVVEGDETAGGPLGEIAAAAVMAGDDAPRLAGIAMEAMARILVCGVEGDSIRFGRSGAAAEWIGATIGAAACLPRLDDAELLEQAMDEALAEACQVAGVAPKGSAKATRAALAGRAGAGLLLFREAAFLPVALAFDVSERLPPVEDCGRAQGAEDCGVCGWEAKPAKGADPAPCDRVLWEEGLARLGLHRTDFEVDDDGYARLVSSPPPARAQAPADFAEQRRRDAEAFDQAAAAPAAEPVLTAEFQCGWSGSSPCREEGTHRCEQLCPRRARYDEWLGTTAGKAAKRAMENAEARASLRRARPKKGAVA